MHKKTSKEKPTCLLALERAADSRFLIILFCFLSTVFSATSPEATLFLPGVCVSDKVPIKEDGDKFIWEFGYAASATGRDC
jgi:hypothetical protein